MNRTSDRRRAAVLRTVAAAFALLLASCAKQTPEQFIAAAQRHLAQDDPAAAQIELRNAIRAAPGHGPAHLLLGTALLRQGDAGSAEAVLRHALSLGQRPDDVLPVLALAVLRQGQAQRLLDEWAGTTLQAPAAQAALRASVGQAWLQREQVDAAAQAFAAALAAQPGHAAALLGQARIAALAGTPGAALALVDMVLKNDPRHAEGHALRSELLRAAGQAQPALEAARAALAADGRHLPLRLGLMSLLIEAKEYAQAAAVLEAAGPAAQDPRVQLMKALLALRQDDLASARAATAAALKAAPEFGAALALAGELELRSGNQATAEQYLAQALRLEPTPDRRRLLATLQLRQGRARKALETLEPLLRNGGEPKSAPLLLLAGEAHLANGDLRRAGEYFEEAKRSGDTEAPARTRLGQLALRDGDFARGERELLAASAVGRQTIEPDLLLVSLHLRRHDADKALAAAQSFIGKQPQNPVGHVLAGTALLAQQKNADARRSFEAALTLQAAHVPALRALAELDLADGKAADAQRRFDAALAKTPDDEPLLVATAAFQQQVGRGEEAAKTLRRAIAAHPRASAPVVELVQLLLRRKESAAALELAQDAAQRNPEEMALTLLLATAQEAAGAGRDAVRTLTAAAVKDPKASAPLIQLGRLQSRLGEHDRAAVTLARALERAPDDDGVLRDLAGAYLRAGKADAALKVGRELQQRRPNAALGHALEGDVLALSRRWAEAERAYRAALKVDPDASDAAAQVYRMLFALERHKEAAVFAADWLARQPWDTTMRLLVADAALRRRDFAAAVAQYETVLRIEPHQPLVLASLAGALGEANDPRALQVAERAAAQYGSDPDVLHTLGLLRLQRGDAQRALETLQRVRELAPDRPDLRLSYAKGLLRNGRTQEAKAELRELAALQADFDGRDEVAPLLATP